MTDFVSLWILAPLFSVSVREAIAHESRETATNSGQDFARASGDGGRTRITLAYKSPRPCQETTPDPFHFLALHEWLIAAVQRPPQRVGFRKFLR